MTELTQKLITQTNLAKRQVRAEVQELLDPTVEPPAYPQEPRTLGEQIAKEVSHELLEAILNETAGKWVYERLEAIVNQTADKLVKERLSGGQP